MTISTNKLGILNLFVMLVAVCFEGPVFNAPAYLGLSELYAPVFFLATVVLNRSRVGELARSKKVILSALMLILVMVPRAQQASQFDALVACKLTYLFCVAASIALTVDSPMKLRIVIYTIPICSLASSLVIVAGEYLNPDGAYEAFFLYRNNPYWGETRQLMGFSKTPNNLALNLVPLLIYTLAQALLGNTGRQLEIARIYDAIFVTALLLVIVLTQSKSLFLGLSLMIFLIVAQGRSSKKIQKPLLFSLIAIYFGLVHFVFLKSSDFSLKMVGEFLGSPHPIFQLGDFEIFISQYLLLKKIALHAVLENPVFGIGLGNFGGYAENFGTANLEKLHTSNPLPHSLYFWIFAEGGLLIGIVFSVLAFGCIKKAFSCVSSMNQGLLSAGHVALQAGMLFFLIEAVSLDVQYNRYFWILIGASFAISASWYRANSK